MPVHGRRIVDRRDRRCPRSLARAIHASAHAADMRQLPAWAFALACLMLPVPALARDIRPGDLAAPAGFKVEAAVTGLAAPTMVSFDEQGRMVIAESGYDE